MVGVSGSDGGLGYGYNCYSIVSRYCLHESDDRLNRILVLTRRVWNHCRRRDFTALAIIIIHGVLAIKIPVNYFIVCVVVTRRDDLVMKGKGYPRLISCTVLVDPGDWHVERKCSERAAARTYLADDGC